MQTPLFMASALHDVIGFLIGPYHINGYCILTFFISYSFTIDNIVYRFYFSKNPQTMTL